jgi:hypothetical protein
LLWGKEGYSFCKQLKASTNFSKAKSHMSACAACVFTFVSPSPPLPSVFLSLFCLAGILLEKTAEMYTVVFVCLHTHTYVYSASSPLQRNMLIFIFCRKMKDVFFDKANILIYPEQNVIFGNLKNG